VHSFVLACGHFFFRHRNWIFPVLVLALLLVSPPRPSFGSWRVDRAMDVAGILVALTGQAIRVLVIGLAYIRRGGKGGKVYAEELVVEGVFAHSRNPLYLGNILVLAGLMIVASSTALTWIGAPFFAFAYACIIAAEEDFLSKKFGAAYDEYRRRVPRFVPRDLGILRTMRSMTFDWRCVLRKEYGSTFSSATLLLAILLVEARMRHGEASLAADARPFIVAWAGCFAAYGTIRFLKKSGRLRKTASPSVG
jgi:protein-S-isoprenylcysteine O-methyltransferase Ste14